MSEYELKYFKISNIDQNPYNYRSGEDPDVVRQIADSIRECKESGRGTAGLLQVPIGRRSGRHGCELAFGNTRLAAFRLLAEEDKFFERFPVYLDPDLDDKSLFLLAWRENADRDEISPIDRARAVNIAREEFGISAADMAREMGISGPTARNLVRFLNLPPDVQKMISDETISQPTAFRLLQVQKIVPDLVDELAIHFSEGDWKPATVSEQIVRSLRTQDNVLELWGSYDTGTGSPARAGRGLWTLDWTVPQPFKITVKRFLQVFPEWKPDEDGNDQIPAEDLEMVIDHINVDFSADALGKLVQGIPSRLIDQAAHIRKPPACLKCEFHTSVDGVHLCALKPCWTAKRRVYMEFELARIAGETEIQIWDKRTDPEFTSAASRIKTRDPETGLTEWIDSEFEAWFTAEERPDHLRIRKTRVNFSPYFLTKSHIVELGTILDLEPEPVPEEIMEEVDEDAEQVAAEIERKEEERQIALANRENAAAYVFEYAARPFAAILDPIENLGVLRMLASIVLYSRGIEDLMYQASEIDDPIDQAELIRYAITQVVLWDFIPFDIRRAGMDVLNEWLINLANELDVPIADALETARADFEAD